MDNNFENKVLETLQRKAAYPCPRCNWEHLEVVGISHIFLSKDVKTPQIGFPGPMAPVALVICKNCGYLMQHSLKVLGLLTEAKGGV